MNGGIVVFLICTVTFLFCQGGTNAKAGWLGGPNNYEECVLEKMKGRSKYLMSTVESLCKKDFPPPPFRTSINSRAVDYTFCRTGNIISVCVNKVPENYILQKVSIWLSHKKPCVRPIEPQYYDQYAENAAALKLIRDQQEREYYEDSKANWILVQGTKSYFSNTWSFDNSDGYTCIDVNFEALTQIN